MVQQFIIKLNNAKSYVLTFPSSEGSGNHGSANPILIYSSDKNADTADDVSTLEI